VESRPLGALDAVLGAVARRRRLEGILRQTLEQRGYLEVAVPLLQPTDGGADWAAAYRVLDQDGRVMDLRPDVTGPVARLCAAGDAHGPRPRRLYYQATIFRRIPGEGPREIAQAGAERIGGAGGADGRITGDAEVLQLVAECLRRAGAERHLLAVGNAAYVRERLASAGMDAAAAEEALRARDFVGLAATDSGGAGIAAEFSWRGDIAAALDGGIRPAPGHDGGRAGAGGVGGTGAAAARILLHRYGL
jgi:ATP phosphoribosyltransferase regulatory subunit